MTITPSLPTSVLGQQHKEAGLRRRILYGFWKGDLQARIKKSVGTERADAWGDPDIGANLAVSAGKAAATLYDREGTISADSKTAAKKVASILRDSGWWALMQRVQRDTAIIRNHHLQVRIVKGRAVFTPVFLDESEGIPHPNDPEALGEFWWRRERIQADGTKVWTWDHWDISKEGAEVYQVTDDTRKNDLSPAYLVDKDGNPAPAGGFKGEDYPFRFSDDEAFINVIVYRAEKTGTLYDWGTGCELIDACLTLGVLWTFFTHTCRSSTFLQRYIMNLMVGGQSTEGNEDAPRKAVVGDPAVVMSLMQHEDTDQAGSVGAFPRPIDPDQLIEAIIAYERRVIALAGINPANVSRQSGDPRSGYALAVNNEEKRAQQRQYAPAFRHSDQRLCRVVARMWSLSTGEALPDSGYRVTYGAIPLSPGELEATRKHVFEMMDRGLMSDPQALVALNPGLRIEDAITAFATIAEHKKAIAPKDEAPEGAGVGGGADVQKTALNGAQVTAAKEVVEAVAQGQLPRETGVSMLVLFYQLDRNAVDTLFGTVGGTFTPTNTNVEAPNERNTGGNAAPNSEPDPSGDDADDPSPERPAASD